MVIINRSKIKIKIKIWADRSVPCSEILEKKILIKANKINDKKDMKLKILDLKELKILVNSIIFANPITRVAVRLNK